MSDPWQSQEKQKRVKSVKEELLHPTTPPQASRHLTGDKEGSGEQERQKCSAETEPQEVCVEEVYLIAYVLFISVAESVIKSLC